MSQIHRTVILSGITAAGKTDLAHELSRELAKQGKTLELINADSVQVYKGFDIGSAKPSQEEIAEFRYHLIDTRNPMDSFTAGDFRREVFEAIDAIHSRGNLALIVGGTGFYLKALLYGMWESPEPDANAKAEFRRSLEPSSSEELHARLKELDPVSSGRIPPSDRYRLVRSLEIIHFSGKTPTELEASQSQVPDPRFELLAIDRQKEDLSRRVEKRARAMLKSGWIQEVERIRSKTPKAKALSAVGYAQICDWLDGKKPGGRKSVGSEEDLVSEICLATRQLCKRQRTWFRSQSQARWFILDQDRAALATELKASYFS